MGVEKLLNDSRLQKTNSVGLYRPPALRNQQQSIETAQLEAGASSKAIKDGDASSNSSATMTTITTTTTSISCNNSPKHFNENCNYENALASTNTTASKGASTTTSTATVSNVGQQQNQRQQQPQAARRERRPDRAVYIPRARRSQTTPPTTAAPAVAIAITTYTTLNNSSSNHNSSSNNNNNQHKQQQQLPITSAANITLVSSISSSKTDEGCKSGSSHRKLKSHHSTTTDGGNRERKERVCRKSNTNHIPTAKSNEKSDSKILLSAASDVENSKVITNNLNLICDSVEQEETTKSLIKSDTTNTSTIATNPLKSGENNSKLQTALGINYIDDQRQELQHISSEIIEMNSTNDYKNNTRADTTLNSTIVKYSNDTLPNLRIEDVVVSTENARHTPKCDIDEQELQRASKEINRSNRRIIKQTFVSDVLEIPDAINHGDKVDKPKSKTVTAQQQSSTSISTATTPLHANIAMDSTTEEEDNDDWENMFDETGECLDPKVMEELTASVGKVKIELPKMDYSAYLTKQSILNEEEFPHVLEVSNFPVEFKNHDLLVLFSQYKESGFDIKWVDDTHALAVFSSSRIAAEALTMGHPFVVLKPLAEATLESRLKAKKCAASLQPYRQRPETCAALARRLVTGALGVRLKTAAAERENEKRVLREAKERKLLAAKQRDEVWDS